jgi:hypothetical protein
MDSLLQLIVIIESGLVSLLVSAFISTHYDWFHRKELRKEMPEIISRTTTLNITLITKPPYQTLFLTVNPENKNSIFITKYVLSQNSVKQEQTYIIIKNQTNHDMIIDSLEIEDKEGYPLKIPIENSSAFRYCPAQNTLLVLLSQLITENFNAIIFYARSSQCSLVYSSGNIKGDIFKLDITSASKKKRIIKKHFFKNKTKF